MAALSSASCVFMGGKRPAKRCASIDLPDPGGPVMSRLCPPAAAISSARLAAAWPFTSARSGSAACVPAGALDSMRDRPWPASAPSGGMLPSGRKWITTSSRCRAPYTWVPGTSAASCALACGSTSRATSASGAAARAMALASAPRTGRSSPDNDSSPANSWPASRAASTCPLAARMPRAMGRSKRPESLGRSAGARFTVMRLLLGNSSPAFWMAQRTRSRASFTSTSARPTSVKLGRPLARCTSTVTGAASRPSRARLCTKDRLTFLPFTSLVRRAAAPPGVLYVSST